MSKKIVVILLFLGVAFFNQLSAQSAVYVFQDPQTGKGDYMFRYGMLNIDSAKSAAFSQIVELGYDTKNVKEYAATDSQGYGIILRSTYRNKKGINITVYGAALGKASYDEAEEAALENMKALNPDWNSDTYNIIQYFYDEPDN